MDLFPYSPRPNQAEFIRLIEEATANDRHIVVESGTGTGKTVCALVGTLQAALRTGKKVLYLTRTNSQEKQVITELRKINERQAVFGIAIQGRQVTCPLFRRDPDLKGGSPEELSRLCREKKRKSMQDQPGGCRFFTETRLADHDELANHCRSTIPTAEEFVEYCDQKGYCPHELLKELAREARVVAAPYAYFFMPFIRNSLLDWMDVSLGDLIVIVDEAHNLPDYTREVESFQLSSWALDAVEKEIEEFGDPDVLPTASIRDVLVEMKRLIQEALAEYLIDEDGLIPPAFVEEGLMSAFTTSSRGLQTMAKALMEQGEVIRERKAQEGRLPRSYIHGLGGFINFWTSLDEAEYVKLIIGGDNPTLRAYCLDPVVTTSVLLGCGGSLHMSGTLVPLSEYRDTIGLPANTALATYPSPFPQENRRIFYLEDCTTKYEEMAQDEDMVPRMEEHVVQICNVMDRNTVVFFPSYALMDRFIGDKVLARIRRKVHVEERGMGQAELMEVVSRFKGQRDEGAVLFSVVGGRISEGIDFPDKDLEVAIIVGVPYPRPTAKQRALMHFYETKFRKGWEYTVKVPTFRKMAQAIGRLIRTETDIGAAVILDRRAKQFSERMEMDETQAPVNDLVNFFKYHTGKG
ncbi:MAG: ATP-dependent DNA helicase [Methanomassiliicoccales archaeon PtaU1.Bin124]|nr:MAG: ATP-dependent DNA helicase [Methanomassiliicoccales archaeon PtaU1.Bin124]